MMKEVCINDALYEFKNYPISNFDIGTFSFKNFVPLAFKVREEHFLKILEDQTSLISILDKRIVRKSSLRTRFIDF